jgi:hypothetical protein
MLRGNKGDWSELYVFAKLLAEGKLFQSDINLNRVETNYYEIIKVYREETNSSLEFARDKDVKIYKVSGDTKKEIGTLSLNYLKEKAKEIYNGILSGKGLVFEIESANDFIERTNIQKLTALATSKSDIKLRIYDHRLAKESDLGFSIKSLLGSDSTLFNTGPGNNFIYEVENNLKTSLSEFNKSTYKPVGNISKITFRLQRIVEELDLDFEFKSIQSGQLWRNLKMIDGDLPELLSFALLYRWIHRNPSMIEVVKLLEEKDPMNFYNGGKSDQKLYEYKIKRFLAECAMGMTSEKPWHGIYDATGGVIICKKDGDVVCFHIYDFNLFREYLLNNTMFEQPSTGEDKDKPGYPRFAKDGDKSKPKNYYYGWPYEDGGKLFFKINLQIRFS